MDIFKKHQIAVKTISLLKMQELWRTSIPIIKLKILINITKFSD